MHRDQLESAIKQFLPEPSVPLIPHGFRNIMFIYISAISVTQRLGDYRAPFQGSTHRISINHDLNEFDFLITLVQ